jgi:predicted regulator of Ras-like GTPase activity (Roadblock/LC7/MglB family)
MSKIPNILDQIVKESDGLLGVCIFDSISGVLITEKNVDSEIDLTVPSAYFSELIKNTKTVFKELGSSENANEFLITANNFYLIIKSIKNMKYHVLCYISHNGNKDYIKEVLKKYEEPLCKEL